MCQIRPLKEEAAEPTVLAVVEVVVAVAAAAEVLEVAGAATGSRPQRNDTSGPPQWQWSGHWG